MNLKKVLVSIFAVCALSACDTTKKKPVSSDNSPSASGSEASNNSNSSTVDPEAAKALTELKAEIIPASGKFSPRSIVAKVKAQLKDDPSRLTLGMQALLSEQNVEDHLEAVTPERKYAAQHQLIANLILLSYLDDKYKAGEDNVSERDAALERISQSGISEDVLSSIETDLKKSISFLAE